MVYLLSLLRFAALVVLSAEQQLPLSFTPRECSLPQNIRGSWYDVQKGEYINLNQTFWSDKQQCLSQDPRGFKSIFFIKTKDYEGNPAVQMKYILEVHTNVFFYRESLLYNDVDVSPGTYLNKDFQLEQIMMAVRTDTKPERTAQTLCPFSENYLLEIYKERDVCSLSKIHQCSSGMQLLVKNDCKHDRKSYKLECKGWWRKAGSQKIIGVFGEEQGERVEYKCFHFDAKKKELKVFRQHYQSDLCGNEPTMAPIELYSKMEINFEKWSIPNCRFPQWFKKEKWFDMTGQYSYETWNVDKEIREVLINGGDGKRTFRCVGIHTEKNEFIAHSATSSACNPIMHCIKVIRRNDNMIELLIGKDLPEYDRWKCEISLKNAEKKILLAEHARPVECLSRGRYTDAENEKDNCKSNLNACLSQNAVTIATMCEARRLECYASWHHGGHRYVLVGEAEERNGVRNCLQITEKGNIMTIKTKRECNMNAPHIFGKPVNMTFHLNPSRFC
ncbi:DgyrCDS13041 [Dimorphilus gyrociliatus]|uniref:DgyrCDS13041 n=1 Tax=Dimorphilus gyrociliatus TaxID=2664684 RepID=A0A7I8W9G6_9ANNE|nr:DgyrCDS13041 [Dimorphilus gyrociliatus]